MRNLRRVTKTPNRFVFPMVYRLENVRLGFVFVVFDGGAVSPTEASVAIRNFSGNLSCVAVNRVVGRNLSQYQCTAIPSV